MVITRLYVRPAMPSGMVAVAMARARAPTRPGSPDGSPPESTLHPPKATTSDSIAITPRAVGGFVAARGGKPEKDLGGRRLDWVCTTTPREREYILVRSHTLACRNGIVRKLLRLFPPSQDRNHLPLPQLLDWFTG